MSGPLNEEAHLLQIIRRTELFEQNFTSKQPVISDTVDVASYNWVRREVPTIVVPGQPAKWTPPQVDQTVEISTIEPFQDANKINNPDRVLEPAAASIFHLNPTFDASVVDIVACGSTLTHLLSFALNEKRSFLIKVEKIGNTIFLLRQRDLTEPYYSRSYNDSMASVFTTWPSSVPDSESHQRIVSYTFGGLRMVVRYESDAYLSSGHPVSKFEDSTETYARTEKLEHPEDKEKREPDSATMIQEPAVSNSADLSSEHSKGELVIESAGLEVPRQSIAVIKSRSTILKVKSSTDLIQPFLPRLWLRQIPNFLVAFHRRGHFETDDSRSIDVRPDVEEWEKKHQSALRIFNNLLRVLIRISGKHEQFTIHRFDNGSIEVSNTPSKWEALSETTMQRWREGQNASYDGSSDSDGTAKKIKLEGTTNILDVLDNVVNNEQNPEQPAPAVQTTEGEETVEIKIKLEGSD